MLVDPANGRLELRWKDQDGKPLETLEAARDAVRSQGRHFEFATNSGIYGRNGAPLGLHVEAGRRLTRLNLSRASTGNFFLQPNGVFFLRDGKAIILESNAFQSASPNPDYASQSGPMLVRAGEINSLFSADSPNRNVRSGVGVARDGRVAFAISRGLVTFREFATLFLQELGCPDALYLDGTISELLYKDGTSLQLAPYVGIWVGSSAEASVSRRNARQNQAPE